MTTPTAGSVELSIMCAPSDLGFLEPTLRHQLRTFRACDVIEHRVLVIDTGEVRHPQAGALEDIAQSLLREGLVDEVRPVDWDPERKRETVLRWYGTDAAPAAARQRAVYQYAFSVDSASADRVLHLDSDMLFHGDAQLWLTEAVDRLDAHPEVAAIVGNGAVPRAHGPREWVLGRRAHRPQWGAGWRDGRDISSRAVLLDRSRIARVLPLQPAVEGEQWEASVSGALARHGLRRSTYVDDRFFMLHPLQHNEAHRRHLVGLIELVESGSYPFRRFGRPWDITTGGWRFAPWRLQLLRRRTT